MPKTKKPVPRKKTTPKAKTSSTSTKKTSNPKKTSSAASTTSPKTRSSAAAVSPADQHPFATLMIFAGLIIIIIALIYYLVPTDNRVAAPSPAPLDTQNATPASELTEEQLAAMLPTELNQTTGTVHEQLGSTALPASPASTQ